MKKHHKFAKNFVISQIKTAKNTYAFTFSCRNVSIKIVEELTPVMNFAA